MLKDEINLMLLSLINNKRALKKFYKTGFFSYPKHNPFKGAVAIVNNKAIVSFLQNVDNENEVIATASFQDNTTFVFQLKGDNFSRTQFGNLPHRCSSNRESVISDISSIRKYCAETEERLISSNPHFINRIFSKVSHPTREELSKEDVKFLLENTLNKLHKSQNLNSRNKAFPKVKPTRIVKSNTPIIAPFNLDKTQEM